MRDYGKISPKFWTGKTGKDIRARGMQGAPSPIGGASCHLEAQIIALYLMSSPHSNMLGLYYQPVLYMAHETGLGIEGAWKGLNRCIETGFCQYDEATEMVWVVAMAKYQIANELKASDKRCAGIQKDYEALPDNPFLGDFFDYYKAAFHLSNRRENEGAYQAPCKPLPSQEQEQEQEQDIKGRAKAPSENEPPESLILENTDPDDQVEIGVEHLPLNTGEMHPILQTEIEVWALAYPAVDIVQEIKRMDAWLTANPKNRKTKSGINRFIVSWLTRQQNRPAGRQSHENSGAQDEYAGAI